ncbi:unnamed protein product [Closterium sp. NIES-53]
MHTRTNRWQDVVQCEFAPNSEFSSDLLREFFRGEGITQSFTLPDSPQQNGIAERRIGLVMEDVTFDESVPFYRLFPYRSAPSLPRPLFLAPGPPPVDHLPPQGPAPLGVSQVDPLPGSSPVQVAVVLDAAPGAASGGAELGGAGSEGAGSRGAEPEGVEPGGDVSEGAELEGTESEGAESGGAEPRGAASSGGPAGASPRLSSQQLHEWLVKCAHRRNGVGGPGAGGARAAGVGVVDPQARGAGGTVRPRPYFVPLLQQVLAVRSSTGLPPPFLCPPPDQSQPPLQPASPLPVPDHESDRARAASPTVARLLATAVTDPSFEFAAVSALVAELLDFAVACRLEYASALVAESVSASPSSIGGECALGTDVLEDRQEDFECLAAAVPRFASLLLAPKGDADAPD